MGFDVNKPADDQIIAQGPGDIRENFRAVVEDKIVNAGKLEDRVPGNQSGDIAINNGTLCVDLNADKLDGYEAAAFALKEHTHKEATSSSAGYMSAADKLKLDSVAAGAEVNQNAFSKVVVGKNTIQADSPTDTLEFVGGDGISVSADASNDRVIITAIPPANTPTAEEKAALAGTAGTPGPSNKYVTDADPRLSDARTPTAHSHTKADITDFPPFGTTAGTICQGNDPRLSNARTPTAHTHTKEQISDWSHSHGWTEISGKPSTYTPSTHSHTWSQISDRPTSLPANGGNADTVDGLHKENIMYFMQASDDVILEANTERYGQGSSTDPIKQFKVWYPGTYRVKFESKYINGYGIGIVRIRVDNGSLISIDITSQSYKSYSGDVNVEGVMPATICLECSSSTGVTYIRNVKLCGKVGTVTPFSVLRN